VTGYFSEIWRLRHFWLALVRIDLRNRYRRSVIGIGWSLLQPIAMTAVLCVVFSQLFKQEIRTFAPFLLIGLTFWGFLTAVVLQGCQCFFQGEPYIRQHHAPLAIYPLRTTLSAGFHFLLGLAIVIVFVCCMQAFGRPASTTEGSVNNHAASVQPIEADSSATDRRVQGGEQIERGGFGNLPALLTLVPTLALVFIIGWSLAVCMGVANVMFQDSQHLTEVVMQIMFYVTPVFLKPEYFLQRRYVSWLVRLNPFAAILELIRKPLLEGQFPSHWAVGMGVLAGLVAVSLATLALYRFEKRMIFYL
jgi:lipopolysaccharide transport system permease protein